MNNQVKPISFLLLQKEFLSAIKSQCHMLGVRGSKDLSVRTGISEETATVLYNSAYSKTPITTVLVVNGREWDDVFSCLGISWAVVVNQVLEMSTDEAISEQDILVPIDTELSIFGYYTAFILKASMITPAMIGFHDGDTRTMSVSHHFGEW